MKVTCVMTFYALKSANFCLSFMPQRKLPRSESAKPCKDCYLPAIILNIKPSKLLKAHLTYFQPFREKRKELEKNNELLENILRQGALKAQNLASETLNKVEEAIGLTKVFN